jgi:hypothetical protein
LFPRARVTRLDDDGVQPTADACNHGPVDGDHVIFLNTDLDGRLVCVRTSARKWAVLRFDSSQPSFDVASFELTFAHP